MIVIAGGSGLIGREIVARYNNQSVVTIDPNGGDYQSFADISWSKFFDNKHSNIFINAAYPEWWLDHIRDFVVPMMFAAQRMADMDGGVIVNLASIYGIVGADYRMYPDTDVTIAPVVYSAAKGAVIAATRAVATQYGRFGVRANCVSPGGVYDKHDGRFLMNYSKHVPLERMGLASEVADAVEFLASERASYITGTNLVIDGGLTVMA